MASAVIGALRINLGIDSAEFQDGLRKAQQSLAGIGKSMTRVGAGLTAAVTAPIVAFGVSIVKSAGDFEASMNRVGAATGATAEELASMSTLARQLGQDTSKSASESADMMEMLAKNGLSVEQILGGAAKSAIALSEATGSDLARSADVATNVMAQFGLKVSDLPRIVDQITASTLASQFGFDDYALALGQAGGVAGGLGLSLTDFNAAITATASVFNSGSDAGTSFKTFLTRLVPASKDAAAKMKELGLEFFDAQGKMKPLAAIAQELQDGLKGLSEEARNDALSTIFGTDALRTAIALGNEGAAGINKTTEALNRQGVAAEQQAARMKGFNGEMEKLKGAFEELQLAIASSGLLESLTQFITKLAEWTTELAKTNPEIVKWGTVVAGLAAVVGPIVITIGLLVTAIAAIGAPIALAIAALVAIGSAIFVFQDEIIAFDQAVTAWARNFDASVVAAFEAFKVKMTELGTSISTFISGAWAQFVAAWEGIPAKIVQVKDAIAQFAAEIPAMFANVAAQMLEIGAQIIDGLWQGMKSKFTGVLDGLGNFASDAISKVKGIFDTHSPSKVMHEIGTNIMDGLGMGMEARKAYVVGVATDTANQAVTATKDAWAGMRDVTKETAGEFDNFFSGIGSTIAEVIKGTKSLSDALSQVGSQLLQSGLQGIFGGAGGGGLGGLFSNLFSGLFGFATGGSFKVGGAGGVDSQLVAFKASPNERVSVTKPGQEDGRHGSGGAIRVYVDDNGNWQAKVEQISQGVAAPMVRAGMQQSNRAVVPTMARYQNDQAGSDYRVA